jgi:2-polyprenyl-6-methoxyphenol hydroxylase-like FAD-dependent oxidoreductase
MADVLIVGAGIGGLTLGLMLERAGIPCRVFEAAPEMKPLGVGINLLPHAMKELAALGLEDRLSRQGVLTQEAVFFNRFGQLIHREALGRAAGYDWPQISIHRGDLHLSLMAAFVARAGADRLLLGWQCIGADADGTARFRRTGTDEALPPQRGSVVVGADGIHSVIRRELYPDEGEPIYSGVNMWRGVTRWPAILGGASMIRCGWFTQAKLVIYPIRNAVDGDPRQLVNWVVEIERPAMRAGTGRARGGSPISSARSRTGISTGSTCRNSCARPTSRSNIRWSTKTRCRAGASIA